MSLLDVRRTGAEDYGRSIKALICGAPGAGKTLLSSTFPNALFLITEPGLMSVADRNVPYLQVQSSDHLMTIKQALEQNPTVRATQFGGAVDTVVIDTVDELQNILIAERLKETKKDHLELKDYGWLKERTSAILKGFRNLDMHVVFTCHLKDAHDEATGAVSRKPGLVGSICDEIPGYVDLAVLIRAVPAVEVIGKESVRIINRFLQTFPDAQHDWVKDRSGKLPQEFKINFADDFDRMARRIYGQAPVLEVLPTPPEEGAAEASKEAPTADAVTALDADAVSPAEAPADEATPEVVEEPAGPVAAAEAVSDGYECESCNTIFDDKNQADLSRIKNRKVQCKPCYTGVAA